jgi:galactokinase
VNPVCTLAGAYHGAFDSDPRVIARAPARVNLLGEHVDYNDGWVLPAAIEQGAWVAASPNSASHLHLRAADFKATVSIPLADLHRKVDMQGRALPTWALYPAGVAWALQQRGLTVGGIDALYTSDVPIGAGLSSSAAVEVAFAMTWQALGGWDLDKMELAQACRHAENAFVGVPCGLMDQFSSLHGVASHVLFFDCRTLHWEAIPLPAHLTLVIADSKIRRTLDDSPYRARRLACQEAVRILAQRLPHVQALRDVSVAQFEEHAAALPPTIRSKAEHVVRECARVQQAVQCLRTGDGAGLGTLMLQGHESLRTLYEVSCPELDTLVNIASALPGCLGARLTGAGFGGCTINLVQAQRAEAFVENLQARYQETTGLQTKAWRTAACQGASILQA